ncbi:hypothetical protein UF37_16010, partial [Vibrio parahaemolyticus]
MCNEVSYALNQLIGLPRLFEISIDDRRVNRIDRISVSGLTSQQDFASANKADVFGNFGQQLKTRF